MSKDTLPPPMNAPTISPERLAQQLAEAQEWNDAAPNTDAEVDALFRLIGIAEGNTGQSRKVADFLLAWWNAGTCGGFDLTTLWSVDTAIAKDILTVSGLIARRCQYPDSLLPSLGATFEGLVRQWRPEVANGETE
ncbi:hypothetical protein ACMHYO_22720 [Allopusillimonas ginsengisoli]|uniref:DUF7673 family protein n=1 Tax=Allopusillimonas ginsengisoli TaxID=453575 RepID=UPI0039C400B3